MAPQASTAPKRGAARTEEADGAKRARKDASSQRGKEPAQTDAKRQRQTSMLEFGRAKKYPTRGEEVGGRLAFDRSPAPFDNTAADARALSSQANCLMS